MLAQFAKKLYLCNRNERKRAAEAAQFAPEDWKEVWVSG